MIYVDNCFPGKWCHMITDGDLEELHEMASRLGLKREWFQPKSFPHYDLRPSKRSMAIKMGAKEVNGREIVDIMRKVRGNVYGKETSEVERAMSGL